MSNMTSSADPHSTKNKAAEGVNTVHNAGFGMGKDKPQGGTSYLNRPGVLQSIKDDHREIEAFYEQAISNIGNRDGYERWANQFVWQVARHSISEELCVYPELGKHLGEAGHKMAESDREDHQYVKDRLKAMESMEMMSEHHVASLKDVMSKLKEHIKEEEEHDFPKLEETLSDAETASIAKSFERTKLIVPTRSHPSAPDRPPFESIAGLFATPMDKLKDMMSKFPSTDERDAVADAAKNKSVN